MGFSIYYRSTRRVDPATADAVRNAADDLIEGRTWLSCEPVAFYGDQGDGHLFGGCKPNFQPHPDDAASADQEGLPNGTVRNMLDILCELSREFEIDWELSHDHDPRLGFIRKGVCDTKLAEQIDALAGLSDSLGDLMHEMDETDDDEGPPILPFRPPTMS